MPTAPKPAPPPAAKPAPTPDPAPAPAAAPIATEYDAPDGWAITYRLHFDKSFSSTQLIEATASGPNGDNLATGPLLVQPDPDRIRAGMRLLHEIILDHIAAATMPMARPAAAAPLPLQQDTPAAAPIEPPAQSQAPVELATPEQLAAIQTTITALPPDWQTYVLEMFRQQFNLPADQKLATRIKTAAHVAYIQSLLPS